MTVARMTFTCPGCDEPRYASRNPCNACMSKERAQVAAKAEAQRKRGTVGGDGHATANIAAFDLFCDDVRAKYGVPPRAKDRPSAPSEGPAQAGGGEL